MMKLLSVEIRIAGEYRDLWLYKRRLYLWDRSGAMKFMDLDTAAKLLAKSHGASIANVVQTLIFRNDWKVGEQFRAMMRVPEMENTFLQPFGEAQRLVVELPTALFSANRSEQYSGLVLDTSIYADRVYFATSEGLLESYIDEKHPERGYQLDQQTDFRIAKVAVRFAAINASAEEKGLFFAKVRFAQPDKGMIGFMKANWMQVADYSLATSHARQNLLNYTDASVPSLLRAKVEEGRTRENARYDENQVVGYERDALDLSSVAYSAATAAVKVAANHAVQPVGEAENFEVLGNSNYHLLTSWNGRMRVIDIRADEGQEVEARPSRKYFKSSIDAIDSADVLQTYSINGGFAVELHDSLNLITRDGSFSLMDGQMARVRTFESSVRHKEVIATVQENGVSLVGFYTAEDKLF